MSFVVADDVCPPQTFCSKSVTSYPFRASSHVTPDPLIPPPTTAMRIGLILTPVGLAKFVPHSERVAGLLGCWVAELLRLRVCSVARLLVCAWYSRPPLADARSPSPVGLYFENIGC